MPAPTSSPSSSSSSNWQLVLVAVEAAVATAVGMVFGIVGVTVLAVAAGLGAWGMSRLTSSKAGASSSMPLSTRKQKLADAERKFGGMFPTVRDISACEARQLTLEQPAQYVLVDVRNAEEQQVSRVPGVLTVTEFEQQREALKDATAVCICTVGYRSSQYAASLIDKGHKAVNLQGGILAWTHAGLPLVDGSDPQQASRRVHTYAPEWAFQADGYEPVYYSHSRFMMVWDRLRSVARKLTGGIDTEATLSAEYGGTGGSNAAVDAVYVALGRVLTISGRTIKDEAQFDPALIKSAEVAIDEVISQLPKQLVEEAQQFRVARAGGKA